MIICLLAVGGMTIFCLLSIQIVVKTYDKKLYDSSLLELEYFSNIVDNEMDAVETLTFEIAMDKEFQSQLTALQKAEDKQVKWNAMSSFKNIMSVESVKDTTIAAIIYDNQNGSKYEINNKGIEIPQDLYEIILQKANAANGAYVFVEPAKDFPYILSGRIIRERLEATLDYLGTLIVAYDVNQIFDENMNAFSGIENNLCVYADQTIIYTNNEELFDKIPDIQGESGYDISNHHGKKYFRCFYRSEKNGWTFVNQSTYDMIYQTTVLVQRIMFATAIMLFIVFAMLLKKICRIIVLPLENLAESMKIVEDGDFEQAKKVLLPAQTQDEAGILSEEFRVMLDKITILIKENYEKQITLIDTKYKALQAQINPHFLYNTLNSIGWMIKAERNQEAQKMVTALGSQLRAAFKKEQFVTIEEELEFLKNYIFIQKIRYEDRIDFIYKTEEEVKNVKIPLLTLQPLVENAINYGAENTLNQCIIKIDIYTKQQRVYIEVSDNGAGMNQERLEEVRAFEMQSGQHGIGLKNIKQRLELIYENDYKMMIDSEEGKGTKIAIEIPLE